jgi:hypothetical protein
LLFVWQGIIVQTVHYLCRWLFMYNAGYRHQ